MLEYYAVAYLVLSVEAEKIGNLLFLQRERIRMHEYAEKIASIGAAANPTFMTLGITPVSWGTGRQFSK
ncbi:hypothetical protein [uncultured Methanocorpusculum sp.]|nr:hypothetical protein [uncultured Methanocorpusculum sp.]